MRGRRFGRGSRKPASAAAATLATAGTGDAPGTAPAARGKYNAQGRRVNGIWMASEAQAIRFEQLLELESRGVIENLRPEVPYPLLVNGVKIAIYRADAVYRVVDRERMVDEVVAEEVKGLETPEWKLKCKMFRALYPDIRLAIITKLSGKDWDTCDPEIEATLVGRKSSFAEQIKVRYAGRIG